MSPVAKKEKRCPDSSVLFSMYLVLSYVVVNLQIWLLNTIPGSSSYFMFCELLTSCVYRGGIVLLKEDVCNYRQKHQKLE